MEFIRWLWGGETTWRASVPKSKIHPRRVVSAEHETEKLLSLDWRMIHSQQCEPFCFVEIFANARIVIKTFYTSNRDYEFVASRWMSEVMYHQRAQALLPHRVLSMLDAYYDDHLFCIVYPRVDDIPRELYEQRIQEVIDIVREMNRAGLYHFDTKPTNFLMRPHDGSIVLHDFSTCAFAPLDSNAQTLLECGQMRLATTGWSDCNAPCPAGVPPHVFNLPIDTMYEDEHHMQCVPYLSRECFAAFETLTGLAIHASFVQ